VRIDHVIYGTSDLDRAAARVGVELGLSAIGGGRHDGLGTHNRIVPLGDGTFLELLAVVDPEEAAASPVGAALLGAIAVGDGLLGWAVAVKDVRPVAARLGTSIDTVGRQGRAARLTGLAESLAEPWLPFFIERSPRPRTPDARDGTAAISWVEVAGDAGRLQRWLGATLLPVRVVDGEPSLRAVGVGDCVLRTR
jgi:hypothetical protein